MAENWTLSFTALSVDVFAWGDGVDDLYSCARARIHLIQRGGSPLLCVLPTGPHAADITVLDLGQILQVARYKRPTPITITYRIRQRAGLTLTFPDSDTLDAFRQLTLPPDPPLALPSCILSYADLQVLGCVLEEDITTAYHRSFVKKDVIQGCAFLHREVLDAIPSTPETVASSLFGTDGDWDDLKSSLSTGTRSQSSDDSFDVFHDAVESPEQIDT